MNLHESNWRYTWWWCSIAHKNLGCNCIKCRIDTCVYVYMFIWILAFFKLSITCIFRLNPLSEIHYSAASSYNYLSFCQMPNMFWLSFNISQMMNDAETDEIRFKFPKWTKNYLNGVNRPDQRKPCLNIFSGNG